jgi:hypothetical protein
MNHFQQTALRGACLGLAVLGACAEPISVPPRQAALHPQVTLASMLASRPTPPKTAAETLLGGRVRILRGVAADSSVRALADRWAKEGNTTLRSFIDTSAAWVTIEPSALTARANTIRSVPSSPHFDESPYYWVTESSFPKATIGSTATTPSANGATGVVSTSGTFTGTNGHTEVTWSATDADGSVDVPENRTGFDDDGGSVTLCAASIIAGHPQWGNCVFGGAFHGSVTLNLRTWCGVTVSGSGVHTSWNELPIPSFGATVGARGPSAGVTFEWKHFGDASPKADPKLSTSNGACPFIPPCGAAKSVAYRPASTNSEALKPNSVAAFDCPPDDGGGTPPSGGGGEPPANDPPPDEDPGSGGGWVCWEVYRPEYWYDYNTGTGGVNYYYDHTECTYASAASVLPRVWTSESAANLAMSVQLDHAGVSSSPRAALLAAADNLPGGRSVAILRRSQPTVPDVVLLDLTKATAAELTIAINTLSAKQSLPRVANDMVFSPKGAAPTVKNTKQKADAAGYLTALATAREVDVDGLGRVRSLSIELPPPGQVRP